MKIRVERVNCPFSNEVKIEIGYGLRKLINCPKKNNPNEYHPEWINYHTCSHCWNETN